MGSYFKVDRRWADIAMNSLPFLLCSIASNEVSKLNNF